MLTIPSLSQRQGDGSPGPPSCVASAHRPLWDWQHTVAQAAARGAWSGLDLAGGGGTVHFPDRRCQQSCC